MCNTINKLTNQVANSKLPIKSKNLKGTPISQGEVLLIVGTEQHSVNYGNALMFPAQAVREVRQNYVTSASITIVIFTDGYTALTLDIIERDAKIWNKNLYFKRINSIDELINYINNGDKVRVRQNTKIRIMKIFAHGMPSRFTFGLDGTNATKQEFSISDITKLKPSSFIPKSVIYSYACRTANCDARIQTLSDSYQYTKETIGLVNPKNSLAGRLSRHLKVSVYAYARRTNYKLTWDDKNDKTYYPTYITIENEKASNPIYYKDIISFSKRLWEEKRNVWDETLWNSKGAYAEVKCGDSPSGTLLRTQYHFNYQGNKS